MTTEPLHPVEPPGPDPHSEPLAEPLSDRERRLRWLLPGAALLLGAFFSWLLYATADEPPKEDPVALVPVVRVLRVAREDLTLTVTAHGNVIPRTESDLVAEVRGRVEWVSPALVAGGFFEADDELLRLDDREHQIALAQARATVSLRGSEAKLAKAEEGRGQELARRGAASASELEAFESRALVAQAQLEGARASLAQADLDLARTRVRAPFDGRVRERSVDVGQFVNPGTKLGRLQAIDVSEVRLPISTSDLAYLDVPLAFDPRIEDRSATGAPEGAAVTLRAMLGGRSLEWPARLVRSEGEIDLRTRTLNVVAEVVDPYQREARDAASLAAGPAANPIGDGVELSLEPERTPLPSGLFVTAEISGRTLEEVAVLPLSALRDRERVFLANAKDELETRQVEILRRGRDRVVVGRGLEVGERVIVSPLPFSSEGMKVRSLEEAAP